MDQQATMDSSFFSAISTFQTKDFLHSQNAELLLLKQVLRENEHFPITPRLSLRNQDEDDDITRLLNLPMQSPCSSFAAALDIFTFSPATIKNANDGRKKKMATGISSSGTSPAGKRIKTTDDVLGSKRMRSSAMKSGGAPPQLVATCSDLSLYTELNNNENVTRVKFEDDLDSFFNNNNNNNTKTGEKVLRAKSFQNLTMRGENRLKIHFINFGRPGRVLQKFGKHGCGIPHGLCGSNQVYDQHWKFEVTHAEEGDSTLICWKITNLASGTVTQVTETPQEAAMRENSGRTICNIVLKQAFESRAQELEQTLVELADNPARLSNVQNLIKALRPKRCTVGLLFFGLLHEVVQARLEEMIERQQQLQSGLILAA